MTPWNTVWSEDDATPGTSGHVTLHMAWQTRYGEPLNTDKADRTDNQTDCVCYHFYGPPWRVAVLSWPGNSEIREYPA